GGRRAAPTRGRPAELRLSGRAARRRTALAIRGPALLGERGRVLPARERALRAGCPPGPTNRRPGTSQAPDWSGTRHDRGRRDDHLVLRTGPARPHRRG